MGDKILLIDGNSILNRAFFALPPLTNSEGLPTNAIYGFLNILFKVLDEEKPDYLIVTFDLPAPTFRHEMYAAYKGTRKPMAKELSKQVPVLKEVLRAMEIETVEKAGLEADDLLGTLSLSCEQKGMSVSILSGDRDILQLATKLVKVRIPITKHGHTVVEDYFASDVKATLGVTPTEFIDVKALMGDASDNIPGVPGIGKKTAVKIIKEYGSIENAHDHLDKITPPRAKKSLEEYWEQAKMSKRLAAIEKHADIAFDLEGAKFEKPYTKKARDYFLKLGFKNFLKRFDVPEESPLETYFRAVTRKEEAEEVFEKARKTGRVGVSFRSNGASSLPLYDGGKKYERVAVAFGEKDIYSMIVSADLDLNFLAGKVSELADHVFVFSMFDIKKYLPLLEIHNEEACFDAAVAAYLINPLKNGYPYDEVARQQLNLDTVSQNSPDSKACCEAYAAYKASQVLFDKLKKAGMDKLFKEIEMPLVFVLYDMERAGIRVQADALKKIGDELKKKIDILEEEIFTLSKVAFNINSPKQLADVLFGKLGLPYGKKTKSGYSTAAGVLERLAKDYPIASKILEYRQLSKLKSTYAEGLAGYIDTDGRIHGKFNQMVAATGRISSTEPNLQNIPVRVEVGKLIRKVFVPKEGCVFLDADYSQIELRVLAHCSKDENLIEAYKESKDIHRKTASEVFHTPFKDVTEQQRRNAKAVNFGIVYGISSFGLSQDLSITRKEAEGYIKKYFKTYPGVKKFLDECVASAREKGYALTMFGRRRPMPELTSNYYLVKSFGRRVAMNAPIQGSAADIIKIAMVAVHKELKERGLQSRILIQVHDELLLEVYKEELEEVKELLKRCMETAADLSVPLVVEMHTGNNWYEAK